MAVLSPWYPPWQSVSALPAEAATDPEVAAAVAAEAAARDTAVTTAVAAESTARDDAIHDALLMRELDYAETLVSVTGLTSTGFAELGATGVLEVSFTAPTDLPYAIDVVIRGINCTAGAPGLFVAALYDSDTDTIVGSAAYMTVTTASAVTMGPRVYERFPPSSGVKTYHVRYFVGSGDTFTLSAAAAKASVHAYIV